MRHVHKRRSRLVVESLQLRAHFHPQLCIQVGKRLVHQQDSWIRRQRPGYRHALLLSSRKLCRIPIGELLDPQQREQFLHPSINLILRPFQILKAKGDVLPYRHMRPERVILEQEPHATLAGRHVHQFVRGEHDFPVDQDFSACRRLKPRNLPQRRGFSAT